MRTNVGHFFYQGMMPMSSEEEKVKIKVPTIFQEQVVLFKKIRFCIINLNQFIT